MKANYHTAPSPCVIYFINFEGKDPSSFDNQPKSFQAKVCYLFNSLPMYISCELKPEKKMEQRMFLMDIPVFQLSWVFNIAEIPLQLMWLSGKPKTMQVEFVGGPMCWNTRTVSATAGTMLRFVSISDSVKPITVFVSLFLSLRFQNPYSFRFVSSLPILITLIVRQIFLDTSFVESLQIIDYSLLLGLHFRALDKLNDILKPPNSMSDQESDASWKSICLVNTPFLQKDYYWLLTNPILLILARFLTSEEVHYEHSLPSKKKSISFYLELFFCVQIGNSLSFSVFSNSKTHCIILYFLLKYNYEFTL